MRSDPSSQTKVQTSPVNKGGYLILAPQKNNLFIFCEKLRISARGVMLNANIIVLSPQPQSTHALYVFCSIPHIQYKHNI